jgi:hypothetical protein
MKTVNVKFGKYTFELEETQHGLYHCAKTGRNYLKENGRFYLATVKF